MWKTASPLFMEPAQKAQVEAWVRAPSTPQKIVLRSRLLLRSMCFRQIADVAAAQPEGRAVLRGSTDEKGIPHFAKCGILLDAALTVFRAFP